MEENKTDNLNNEQPKDAPNVPAEDQPKAEEAKKEVKEEIKLENQFTGFVKTENEKEWIEKHGKY